MKILKGIDGKLDIAWSKLIKLKAGNRCEIKGCGRMKNLNSHHIFGRRNKSVRWEVMNGVALCPSHHTLDAKFSAHATPVTFTNWLIREKGQNFVDILTIKSNTVSKLHAFEKELLLNELNKEIEEYESRIII